MEPGYTGSQVEALQVLVRETVTLHLLGQPFPVVWLDTGLRPEVADLAEWHRKEGNRRINLMTSNDYAHLVSEPEEQSQAMHHSFDPWSPRHLQSLTPKRRYTALEVEHLMAALSGLVSDGLPLRDWEIEEKPGWFEVLVRWETFDNPAEDPRGDLYEVWSFFKAAAEAKWGRTQSRSSGNEAV